MGHLIAWLLVGLIAGALAGRVVEGGGFGFLGDVVVGLAGGKEITALHGSTATTDRSAEEVSAAARARSSYVTFSGASISSMTPSVYR